MEGRSSENFRGEGLSLCVMALIPILWLLM